MFTKISILKGFLGLAFGLGAAITITVYAVPTLSDQIAQYWDYPPFYNLKKPAAPEIVDQKVEGGCKARIWYQDNSLDEDGLRFYRRANGSSFVAIEVKGPHDGIPGSFDDANLPVGTYEYEVGAFNQYGESFSNVSQPFVIDDPDCGTGPLLVKPLNPIIIKEAVEGGCKARIWYHDNSLDEDGVRIYRRSFVEPNPQMIDELGPNDGIRGSYDDPNLPPTTYNYQVSVFNENGEAFSLPSEDIVINDPDCEPPSISVIEPAQVLISTPTPTPSPFMKACTWKAAINVFVRTGPGASLYPNITAVEAGAELPVVGQSEDRYFWAVDVDSEVLGYVPKAEKFGMADGDCAVPTLPDPEPPEQAPQGGGVAPQCSDGADNDADGAIDMRDRDCSNPDDNNEFD